MSIYYKLDDERNPVQCRMHECYAGDNGVERTELTNGYVISTVFLYINHNHDREGEPILFETMVFPPNSLLDEDRVRYHTWDESVKGHWGMVEKYGGEIKIPYITHSLDDELFKI